MGIVKQASLANLKPFKKGESGNPKGRPAIAKGFRDRCKGFMEKDGWKDLMEVARNAHDKDRVRALELIAAYAYGKPSQEVKHDVSETVTKLILDLVPTEKG
jgi:hypothetical protein